MTETGHRQSITPIFPLPQRKNGIGEAGRRAAISKLAVFYQTDNGELFEPLFAF